VRAFFGGLLTASALAAVLLLHPAVRAVLGVEDAGADRATPVAGGGSYRFMQHQRGAPETPVTYDPCRVIRIRINTDGVPEPDRAREVVLDAMRKVSAATGLRMEYAGPSSERPHWPPLTQSARSAQSSRAHPEPVLVAFATAEEVPRLKGRVAGVGGSTSVRRDGTSTYVSGEVTLDSHTFGTWLAEPAFLDSARATVLHELGHLVGLAHVQDDRELMNAKDTGQTDFGPGDRTGLALLGQGPCA
jgi:hypothetical protein